MRDRTQGQSSHRAVVTFQFENQGLEAVGGNMFETIHLPASIVITKRIVEHSAELFSGHECLGR